MKKILISMLFLALVILQANAQKTGWVNLFDGKTTNGWHNWKSKTVNGWHVMNGELMTHGNTGDLVTNKEYGNFILEFEFKVSPTGNSGVIYKVLEDTTNLALSNTYVSGPEYQVIDDENYGDKLNDNQKTASNYEMNVPNDLSVVKNAGEWNKGKIIVKNNFIEHWLNGKKVVSYEYGSEAWKENLAKSKFKTWPYATPHLKGHIALQDHGHIVSYKKMRIKEL